MTHRDNVSFKRLYIYMLIGVVVFKIILQYLLFKSGFVSLTADEFGRTVVAANWAVSPEFITSGFWLPFHTYMVGILVYLGLNWWNYSVIITFIFSTVSIVFIFLISFELFKDYNIALISSLLLACNPLHTWLSVVPLSEMPVICLNLIFLFYYMVYLRRGDHKYIIISMISILLSSGFRYETWIFLLISNVFGIIDLMRSKSELNNKVFRCTILLFPWIVPLFWAFGNYYANGDFLYFYHFTKEYELTYYGSNRDYLAYLMLIWKIDPIGVILLIYGILVYIKDKKYNITYICFSILPIVLFFVVQGGLMVPEGQMYRRLSIFLFMAYPLVSYGLVNILYGIYERLSRFEANMRFVFVLLPILILCLFQSHLCFDYKNDPSVKGFLVGRKIYDYIATKGSGKVFSERIFWDYLSIQVGANSLDSFIFDRDDDYTDKGKESLIRGDISAFGELINSSNVNYVLVRSGDLSNIVSSCFDVKQEWSMYDYDFFSLIRNGDVVFNHCR